MDDDERRVLSQQILGVDKLLFALLREGMQSEFMRVDLTMPQLKVLLLLFAHEGRLLRMGQLAGGLGVTLPTMTGIVDRLVEQGATERREDPRDRRLVVVGLTEQGREQMERLVMADRRRLEAVISRLGLDALRTVARAFDVLYQVILLQTREESAQLSVSALHETPPVTAASTNTEALSGLAKGDEAVDSDRKRLPTVGISTLSAEPMKTGAAR